MAKVDSIETAAINEVSLAADRKYLCLEGVWELDKIARTLPGLVPPDEDQEHFIVRAPAGRMLRINGMLLSALDDPAVETSELKNYIDFENGQG